MAARSCSWGSGPEFIRLACHIEAGRGTDLLDAAEQSFPFDENRNLR